MILDGTFSSVDWNGVDIQNPKHTAQIVGHLMRFCQLPDSPAFAPIRAQMQYYATTDDFPAKLVDLLQKTQMLDDYDAIWERAFDIRDFTSNSGPYTTGFSIGEVGHNLTFEEVPAGDKIKVRKMAGASSRVAYNRFGGGLGWEHELFLDGDWWTIENNAKAFRSEYLLKLATIGYALIEAVSATNNTAWTAPIPSGLAATDPNYVAIRDAETINAACLARVTALKDEGWSVTADTKFEIIAPLALKQRLTRAMGVANAGLSGNFHGVQYNVRIGYTLMLSSQTEYYVIIPGHNNIIGVRENLSIEEDFDILTRSKVAAGWFRRGGAINATQVSRCATS